MPAEIKIGIDDKDLQELSKGADVTTAVSGAAKSASKNVKQFGETTEEASGKQAIAAESVFSSMGRLVKMFAAGVSIGKIFSLMAQVSGPFIAAMAKLNVVMIKIAQAVGEGLGPIIEILVGLLDETVPLFKAAGDMLKLFASILKPIAGILKRYSAELQIGIVALGALWAIQKAYAIGFAKLGPAGGALAAAPFAIAGALAIEKIIGRLREDEDEKKKVRIRAGGAPGGAAGAPPPPPALPPPPPAPPEKIAFNFPAEGKTGRDTLEQLASLNDSIQDAIDSLRSIERNLGPGEETMNINVGLV